MPFYGISENGANIQLDQYGYSLRYEYSPEKQGKAELIWRQTWETGQSADTAIFESINGFDSPRRGHSALGTRPEGTCRFRKERWIKQALGVALKRDRSTIAPSQNE